MKAIDRLIELKIKQLGDKYPSFPKAYIPKPKYKPKTANGLTACIIDWIQLNGFQAERISNTGRFIPPKEYKMASGYKKQLGTGEWIKGTGTNGTADISSTILGRSVKIEVKIGNDRQSDDQKKYEENVKRAGGEYWIAKTFEGFLEQYDNFIDRLK